VKKVYDFKLAIEQAVAVAFAQALAGAETHYNGVDACFAWVNAGGCIYTTTHPDAAEPNCDGHNIGSFECTAASVSAGQIEEIDALAEASAHLLLLWLVQIVRLQQLSVLMLCHACAIDQGIECGVFAGAEAAAWTCGDSAAYADVEVSARALAKAAATAISFAYAQCKLENGWACAVAGTEISETARAVAVAYASLWAGADNGAICGADSTCSVSVDAVAVAVGDVLVTACSEAYASVCAGVHPAGSKALVLCNTGMLQAICSACLVALLDVARCCTCCLSACSDVCSRPEQSAQHRCDNSLLTSSKYFVIVSQPCCVRCADGTGFWSDSDFELYIVEHYLCALAEASATAISEGGLCIAGGYVYAETDTCKH
jgi:hypothetical protein